MRIENKPSAWGWLAGLLVLLLGLAANASCAHTSVLTSRGVVSRYVEAVEIEAMCIQGTTTEGALVGWHGSGVIVSSTRVLTANHVVATRGMMCVFQVTSYDGAERLAMPAVVLPDFDLASLKLIENEKPFVPSPVGYGRVPDVGDTVCAATGNPWRGHKCAEVQPHGNLPGDIQMLIIVEPGNSGSGLYNTDGELVGIVTHRFSCGQSNQTCGGKAASLEGHIAELMK
jgi:S1-C subfamily serine protease